MRGGAAHDATVAHGFAEAVRVRILRGHRQRARHGCGKGGAG